MELSAVQLFKAMNDKHTNLKECEGLIIHPVAAHTHQYTSADGKEHSVLVILNGKDNTMYKTEVKAFIEKYLTYETSFGSLPDDQKPEIKIIINTSKAGNRYVNFELMEN